MSIKKNLKEEPEVKPVDDCNCEKEQKAIGALQENLDDQKEYEIKDCRKKVQYLQQKLDDASEEKIKELKSSVKELETKSSAMSKKVTILQISCAIAFTFLGKEAVDKISEYTGIVSSMGEVSIDSVPGVSDEKDSSSVDTKSDNLDAKNEEKKDDNRQASSKGLIKQPPVLSHSSSSSVSPASVYGSKESLNSYSFGNKNNYSDINIFEPITYPVNSSIYAYGSGQQIDAYFNKKYGYSEEDRGAGFFTAMEWTAEVSLHLE